MVAVNQSMCHFPHPTPTISTIIDHHCPSNVSHKNKKRTRITTFFHRKLIELIISLVFIWENPWFSHGLPMVCPWFTHGLPLLHHVAGERQGHLRAGAKVGTHRHISSALDEKRFIDGIYPLVNIQKAIENGDL